MNEKEILAIVDEVIKTGPCAATWDSLAEAPVPEWFRRRRLGIFIHWGVYSVPAYSNEWYSREMYIEGSNSYNHHVAVYGPQKDFGYKDFIPLFRAEKFDARAWAALFRRAGAGYVCPVAEHHDGFQMYDSDLSRWNAAQMGPGRDVLGELKAAVEGEDMAFCASSHRAEHWFFMGHGREFDSDVKEPMKKGDFYWPAMPEPKNHHDLFSDPVPTAEFLEDWLARTAEIIMKYEPRLLYFDWWIQHSAFKPYLRRLAAFYYNWAHLHGFQGRICYKHDAMAFGTGIVDVERGGFAEAKPYPWQTDTSVARNSWCHTNAQDYKSGREIIHTLVDVVSKGGNLLLNVGPRADGTIPDGDRQILETLGAWMAVNREAIDGAKPWRQFKEGPTAGAEGQFQDKQEILYTGADYRFTAGHGTVYAVCMKCPEDGRFTVKALGDTPDANTPHFHGIIEKVELLGYDGPLKWHKDAAGLHIESEIRSDLPVTIKVTVD